MSSASALIPRSCDEPEIAVGWERFIRHEALRNSPIRDVVLASWHRCRADGVDPTRPSAPGLAEGEHLRRLRERNRHFYEAARPVLATLKEVLRESGTIIMLTDPAGTILDLDGDNQTRRFGEQINLATGSCWDEELIGTNAIGTAIAARKPVQIYASEHYCFDVKSWTCAGVPITDPTNRALLGVLNVSGIKETFHGHSLGLVIAAAQQIETALAQHDLERHGRLLEQSLDVFARYGNDNVVLFDRRGNPLKNNGRAGAAAIPEGQVAALDLSVPSGERDAAPWLKPEWVHPIEGLGTVLVIPPARRIAAASEAADPLSAITGNGTAIVAARMKARRLAPLDLPVLLLGETGVGKEVFARAIHKAGAKPQAPFVAVNCGAFTREFLATELFGYADGAYTGARRGGLPGKFELADGGTLFLDEIGEMPLDLQPHLLRVLQDGIVARLGDTRQRRVTVRIIAATNRDLHSDIASGRFRADLFHRLNAASLHLPALRERPEDIDALIDGMNAALARKYGCAAKTIAPSLRQALANYAWPGNIRELKNVFETLFALSDGTVIDASQLPPEIVAPAVCAVQPLPSPGLRLDDMERQAIRTAVAHANGNLSRAARNLGISRSTLYLKLAAIGDRAPANDGAPA